MSERKGSWIFCWAVLFCSLSMIEPLWAQDDLSFIRRDIETRGFTQAIASSDFNGDKILDLAVTGNFIGGGLMILLGQQDGTFKEVQRLEPGGGGPFVLVGDLNSDGIPDLAVPYTYTDTVAIWLGAGDGTFKGVQPVAVGSRPVSITLGDFNGDAVPDLAVANSNLGLEGPGSVSILLGIGDGTFAEAHDVAVGVANSKPSSVASGDFNNDGRADLVATSSLSSYSVVSVLIGKGDGTFQATPHHIIYGGATAVTIGDFNGDALVDLAVVSRGNGDCMLYPASAVAILLNQGGGRFWSPQYFMLGRRGHEGCNPNSIAAGDFNGDGTTDLAVATGMGSHLIAILLGAGDGTFRGPQNLAAGLHPQSIIAADFDGDGQTDLAVANYAGGSVSLFLNRTPQP